jgi:hypothetical protein
MIESTGDARVAAAPHEHFLEVGLAEPLVAAGLRMKEAAANLITYRVTAWLKPIACSSNPTDDRVVVYNLPLTLEFPSAGVRKPFLGPVRSRS